MPPPLELPTIQNWSCHNCGGCCRQHAVEITVAERDRILSQNWRAGVDLPHSCPVIVKSGSWPWRDRYQLGHQPDGACVFLDERGLCRIHARFGEAAKPLACRIYPYAFHPAGRKIAVSLRFSCPSVAANRGRSLVAQRDELKLLEKLVVPDGAERIAAPEVLPGQQLDWGDTLAIVEALDRLIAEGTETAALRLVRALHLVDLLGQSRFDKIRGSRLREYLEIVSAAALAETAPDLAVVAEPGSVGRTQFRLLCAQYARRDTLADRGAGWGGRWRLLRAAVQFARGRGTVPPLQPGFQPVPFSSLEQAFGPLPPESEEMLIRYLRVKICGLHFCGRAYYDVPLVEGFQSLALVIPVVLWLARWRAASAGRTSLEPVDVADALAVADHHHGYSPAFGQTGFRGRVRLLARLNEIARLAAWYSR